MCPSKQDEKQYRYYLPMERSLAGTLQHILDHGQRKTLFTEVIKFCVYLYYADKKLFEALADGTISMRQLIERLPRDEQTDEH